ncbi:Protein of unknown function [Gryllus bimaculatus]|nr:Protein of unknown function [Gryllus bimaculatus]
MNRFGRKKTLCSSLLASGLCCFLFIGIPGDWIWLRIALYLFGKFNITISFDVLYIFAVELFPTELRQTCLAACSVLGGMGQILAPQLPLLSNYMESLPLILFGSMSVASGILALLLPETQGTKLPDTLEEKTNKTRCSCSSRNLSVIVSSAISLSLKGKLHLFYISVKNYNFNIKYCRSYKQVKC